MRRKHWVFVATLGTALAAFGGYYVRKANAFGIPEKQVLTYRGTLTDVNGTPATGTKNIQVTVWDNNPGGSAVCPSVAAPQTALVNGTFQVSLPDACAEAVRNSPDLWVEVSVDGASLGRSRFGAVPYAIEARTASNAAGALATAIEELRTKLASVFAAVPGTSAQYPGASCAALRDAGFKTSGNYWVKVPASADTKQTGKATLVYCDQVTNEGGWALVYNSVMLPETLTFWNIPYAARLSRRGVPSLGTNFYDGSLYQTNSATYMDVIEDLRGGIAVAMVATTTGLDAVTMRFANPANVSGNAEVYASQFASGWSAPDYDGDANGGNCSTGYSNISQHYSSCWVYNLGSDADTPYADGNLGPHLHSARATALGLASDGTDYTRVRRISRFVRW